ncbi:MAG: redoxin domain-containing protein [Candidatus Dormibacteraeota bacterium]|nr:redoxin domain-containing protein [Candidatus Dormibacteraeota bacterium]
MLAATIFVALPRFQPATGTLVVAGTGRTAGSIPPTSIELHGRAGWTALGQVSGVVPAAPGQRVLLAVAVVAGTYDGIRLGVDQAALPVVVTSGQVEPVLLGVDSGRLINGAVYAGNDQVNLGLGELSGKFVALPAFSLQDHLGHAFDSQTTAGMDLVIAAFHTTCHQTCPLYTALFFQLQKRLPRGVLLAEVTTDPATDTPAVLDAYGRRIGAGWTFATGSAAALAAFWKPFGVNLSSGDSHVSTLALVDRHGYVRLVYRGVPDVGNDIAPSLVTTLGPDGLRQLASHGDGWGAPSVIQSLLTISGPEQVAANAGGRAPAFQLESTDGGRVALADLTGKPLIINFWASYCPPCRAEMPLLQRRAGGLATARLVLIDEGDTSRSARDFLMSTGIQQPALLDSDLNVGKAYGVLPLPTTVFVRADGTIAGRQVGELDDRVLASWLSILTTQ